MDRLDFQTTGRFNRQREQRTRSAQFLLVKVARDAKVCHLDTQTFVIAHGPFAQAFEQTVLHLGRGGFCVGQAQDMLRFDPFEQQSRHTVG